MFLDKYAYSMASRELLDDFDFNEQSQRKVSKLVQFERNNVRSFSVLDHACDGEHRLYWDLMTQWELSKSRQQAKTRAGTKTREAFRSPG